MAKKEKPIVDNEVGKLKVKEQQPKGKETKGNITEVKEKMKAKPVIEEESITKVDLTKPIKPEENETKKDNADDSGVVAESENANAPQEQEEVQPETEAQETPAIEEVTDEEVEEVAEQIDEAVTEAETTGEPLPENIQKLVDFMSETGGDINDYVKLNRDYSDLDDKSLLYEYYSQTKPHLNNEEINFLMEDQFSYDEEVDEDRDIRRKKLALKEQVANAKSHLDGQKSKYYEEIKAGSKLTTEQQKAMDFFNRYNKESKENEAKTKAQRSTFENKTSSLFNEKFKGFEYNVGDKKFRFNVKDVDSVKEAQSNSDNFFKKFLDKNNHLKDAKEFHKSLYTATNADAIANHFYEQGKADAMKDSIEKAKNVDMTPRQGHSEIESGGIKVRVLGDTTEDFKFKIRNKNK
jgi:hypothetical protein